MRTPALVIAALTLWGCDPDVVAPAPALTLEPKSWTGGIVPYVRVGEAYALDLLFTGSMDMLRGNLIAKASLANETGSGTVLTFSPRDDGSISLPVRLLASRPGRTQALVEVGGKIARAPEVMVPSGKLSLGYLEELDGGLAAGCVNLTGEAGTLWVQTGAEPLKLSFRDGTCDGPGEGQFAQFPSSASFNSLTVGDLGEEKTVVPLVLQSELKAPRALSLSSGDGGTQLLPAAGLPMLVSFRIHTEGKPTEGLPYVGFVANVAPEGPDALPVSHAGTTDAEGRASIVVVAPTVDRMVIVVKSGRLEYPLWFNR